MVYTARCGRHEQFSIDQLVPRCRQRIARDEVHDLHTRPAAFGGGHTHILLGSARGKQLGTADNSEAVPNLARIADKTTIIRSVCHKDPNHGGGNHYMMTGMPTPVPVACGAFVTFHPSYLREWLSKRGYSPQKPVRRAKQRNPQVIDAWLGRAYPALQKKSRPTRPTSC